MLKLPSFLNRIPYFESLRSFLEQWGLWPYLLTVASLCVSLLVALWAWLESHLPYWGIFCIFLFLLTVFFALTYFIRAIILDNKKSKNMDRIISIDRDSLADHIEDISRKIASLVGEYRGPMQEAWWADTGNRDISSIRLSYNRVEGKLVEKYSDRYAADVWRLIRRASKVVIIDQTEIWRVQHGVRGESDLITMYMFLSALADDVRTPRAPLPKSDRLLQEMAVNQDLSVIKSFPNGTKSS
ncbi:MAG: hypothetical protein ABII76_04585 [Pseudomonadota bacterium]